MVACQLNGDPLPWLLEPDPVNPGIRYFALRDLVGLPADHPDVIAAQTAVMTSGPVPVILAAQNPEGYWDRPGSGYVPKYRGTIWAFLFMAQLGARIGSDARVQRAVDYVFANTFLKDGSRPEGNIHCLWGNLVRAMIDLGVWGDERLSRTVDRLAQSVIGEDYGPYLKTGIQGPNFLCSHNYGLPCAWGAVRVLWALCAIPPADRSPVVQQAIEQNLEFLLRYNIAQADYPYMERISANWFEFGYPLGYITDLLLNLEALTEAGCVDLPRLQSPVALVLSKQDAQGRWKLAYSYHGKMWIDVEKKGRPSKWITLRALRVLKRLNGVESRLYSGAGMG